MIDRATDALLTAALVALCVLCWLALIVRVFLPARPNREGKG